MRLCVGRKPSECALKYIRNGAAVRAVTTAASAPSITVGALTVRYVAERACTVTPVTNPLRQCLVKQVPQPGSHVAGQEQLDPPNSKQFRITVMVTGPKGTQTWVQSLVTKG